MKKTLVIHPEDKTTDMLKHVYKNHPEYTVCRDNGINKKQLKELIGKHDRIIMLGHGLPMGLIGSSRKSFLVDDSFAELLRTKETVSVWCYSDMYFERNRIAGFHTGMIISEVDEELYIFGKEILNRQEMLENFKQLSVCFGECIEFEPEQIREYMLKHYNSYNPITEFNRRNMKVIQV